MINFAYAMPKDLVENFSEFMRDSVGNREDSKYVHRFRRDKRNENILFASKQPMIEVNEQAKLPIYNNSTDNVFNNVVIDGVQYMSVNEYCQDLDVLKRCIKGLEDYVTESRVTGADIIWIGAWEFDGMPVGMDFMCGEEECSYDTPYGRDTKIVRIDWRLQGSAFIPTTQQVIDAFVPIDEHTMYLAPGQQKRLIDYNNPKPPYYNRDVDVMPVNPFRAPMVVHESKEINEKSEILGRQQDSEKLLKISGAKKSKGEIRRKSK